MSRISQLETFADRDPTNPDLLCDLLDSLLLKGDVQRARARLDAVSPSLRSMPGVVFREARCALLEGNAAQVVSLLQPLVATLPSVPAGLGHDLAYAQFLLGDLEGALRSLALVSATGEDAAALTTLKARIWHHQQRYADALALLDEVDDAHRSADFLGLRALLLLDSGKTRDAFRDAAQALALKPDQYEAGLVSGAMALWEQRGDIAVVVFQQLITMQPAAGRAYLGLGEGLMAQGDITAALAALERAASRMPDHIGTWHAIAWCQLLQGNLDGAQASFDRAFAIDRTFGESHGGRALVHALRGEKDAAHEAIKRALRLDPNGRSARYAQSVLLLDEGREDEARQIIDALTSSRRPDQAPIPADFVYALRELLRPTPGGAGGH